MSKFIKYKKEPSKKVAPMRMRRFLKVLLKNIQRYPIKQRETVLAEALAPFGLTASWYGLQSAMTMSGATGKHFSRLGKAAKKKGMLVDVYAIAVAVKKGQDLRKVSFYPHRAINIVSYA
jgi:hypothetical protein